MSHPEICSFSLLLALYIVGKFDLVVIIRPQPWVCLESRRKKIPDITKFENEHVL